MGKLADALAAFAAPAAGWWTGRHPPKFYGIDPHTGELIASGNCDPSPLEEGVWLYPGSSTHVTPPPAEQGFARVWDGESWTQVRDRRGEIVWAEGEFRRIATLGEHPELKLEVHDAQYLAGGMIRMWVGNGAVDVPDDPTHPARQIVEEWVNRGETIRPADPEPPEPAQSDTVPLDAGGDTV